MSLDTQGMSPDEAELTAELDGNGLPPELDSEAENRKALQREEGDAVDEDPSAAAAAPAPTPAPATAPATAPAVAEQADDASGFEAPYKVDLPADADQKLNALKTEERDAFKKFSDGDLTAEAYTEIRERTEAESDEIKQQITVARTLAAANEQNAETAWKRAQRAEFATFKTEGLDYMGKPAMLAAYNHHLKGLAGKPEHEAKSAEWFLREAHRLTKADLGITAAAPTPAPTPAPKPRGVDPATLPPTLARVPPAADATVDGDEFGYMASLRGADAEKALAAMTPEQLERYLT